MMRLSFRSLPMFLLLAIFACCSDTASPDLDRAESLIRHSPDTALVILDGLDPISIVSKADRARYRFLYAMSLNRLKRDTLCTDFLQPVMDYYRRKGNSRYLMQTLYCQGRIYAEQEDWQQAMICFKEAEDLSEKTDDLYFKVLLNSFLSHMYYVNYDNESSLKYAQKTLNMFDDGCFNEEWKREQLMSVANLLDQNGCISQSDSIFHIIFNQLDTTMASSSELIYSARSAMGKKHMDPIRNAIYTERAIAQGASLDVGDSYQYCYSLLLLGRFTEFQSLLDSLRLLPSSLNSNYWNYKISRRLNDYEAALSYCEDFASEKIQDMIAKNNHSIHKAQIDYLKALSDLRRT